MAKRKELITQSAYARRIGKTPQHIYNLVKNGTIKLKNKKVDPVQANEAIKKRTQLSKSRKKKNKLPLYYESQAKHEFYKAQMKKLEVEEREGNLIPKSVVDKILFEKAREMRDRILAINDRMQPFLDDEQAELLEKEIFLALKE